jgi:hypothetical protein
MARRKAPHLPKRKVRYLNYLTRLLGAPSPRILRGTEMEYGVPGAAKNTGADAWLGAVAASE